MIAGEPNSVPADLSNPRVWAAMVECAGPASLLIVIESRMGPLLRSRVTAEDVWQEALLEAWRDRGECRASSPKEFRAWLLTVIDHRVLAAVDHFAAAKRGGPGTGESRDHKPSAPRPPVQTPEIHNSDFAATSTPSRLASFKEQASIMRQALAGLDEDVREVVRLRLFEQLPVNAIGERVGIGPSAVRHRFRRGVERYHQLLRTALASRGATMMSGPAHGEPESSSVVATPPSVRSAGAGGR